MNNQHSALSKAEHIRVFGSNALPEPPHSVVVDSSGLPVEFVVELDVKKLRFPAEVNTITEDSQSNSDLPEVGRSD